jgi:ABC-type multidrug transport system fused ATPase/permease subunit
MEILQNPNEDIKEPSSIPALSGSITFKNVDFHYETRDDVPVIKDLSFNVNPGETVAIVGPSGAGKSTITSLMLRFYDVEEGGIFFDGKNAKDYDLADLRSQMAIVPQEVMLFAGTIQENIAYGKPGASDQEIIDAAERANALEFINKFPTGMETLVGDRGVQLSGGQKQRIAIARAILKNPTILILDEATSSLDSESEKLVQDALEKLMKDRTSVVIAHRLSTIKNADNILVLDKGVLVEQGKHDDLISQNGIYTKLSSLQFG